MSALMKYLAVLGICRRTFSGNNNLICAGRFWLSLW